MRPVLPLAVWRGVPFHLLAHTLATGRRTEVHEYPLRDSPSVEDLGRSTRRITIEGVLLGDDHAAARDAITRACELPGAGVLLHPAYGRLSVVCESFEVSESADQGLGAASVRLSFVEAGELRFPTGITGSASRLASAIESVKASALDDFLRVFDVLGSAVSKAAAVLHLGEILDGIEAAVRAPGALLTGAFEAMALIESVKARVSSIVSAPGELAAGLLALVEGLDGGAVASVARGGIVGIGESVLSEGSSEAVQTSRNRGALSHYLARIVLAEFAGGVEALAASLLSLDEVDEARERFAGGVEVEELDPIEPSPALYNALVDLRTQFSATLDDLTSDRARIELLDVEGPLPAVVLAYQLYGDPAREAEIVGRNRAIVPLALSGELRVLSS